MWPVKWKKNGQDENLPNYQLKNSVLKFDFLSQSDFGEYTCTSFNLFGVAEIKLLINSGNLIMTNQIYKPSIKRKLGQSFRKKTDRRQRLQHGTELRKHRFKKKIDFVKHEIY